MATRWGRRERTRIVNGLLRLALIEIRYLARQPETAEDRGGALDRIGMIADACHNLPGAERIHPRTPYDLDPFVYLWQTSTPAQRKWLIARFQSLDVDYQYLLDSAPWPPPARTPAMRPRLRRRGARVPHTLSEYVALDTATLRSLTLEAAALEPSGRKRPEHTLAHLDPAGRHLVRASRPGEVLFLPAGPHDLHQYRGLLQMMDGATIVGHLRLRASSFASLPSNMTVAERLRLAATVPQPHERDTHLWTRDHRATDPQCPLCRPSPTPESGHQT